MSTLSVLVVDHDKANLDLLEAIVADLGCKMFRVQSGPDAIGLMMSTRVDLVLVDIEIPEMNGFAILEVIRTIPRLMHTHVIMQSRSHDRYIIERAKSLGAHAVIIKSETAAVLAEQVRQIQLGICEPVLIGV